MMGSYKKIPVVKNKLSKKKKQRPRVLRHFGMAGVVLGIFLTYMWISVKANSLKQEIRYLENELKAKTDKNQELRASVEQLSDFARINKIAQEDLGLTFLSNEDIIEIK